MRPSHAGRRDSSRKRRPDCGWSRRGSAAAPNDQRRGVIEVREQQVSSGTVIRPERKAVLLVVMEGRALVELDGAPLEVVFGDCLMVFPGNSLAFVAAVCVRTLGLSFEPDVIGPVVRSGVFERGGGAVFVRKGLRQTVPERDHRRLSVLQIHAVRALARGLARDGVRGDFLLGLSKLYRALHLVVEEPGAAAGQRCPRIHPVLAALQHIQENFKREIPSTELRGVCNVSKSILYREFRRQTGFSPGQYQTHLRIAAARRLLEESLDNVTEIAYQVGFADSNYFTKLFSRYMNIPPARYRKQWCDARGRDAARESQVV